MGVGGLGVGERTSTLFFFFYKSTNSVMGLYPCDLMISFESQFLTLSHWRVRASTYEF